jgi:hypothetical protein
MRWDREAVRGRLAEAAETVRRVPAGRHARPAGYVPRDGDGNALGQSGVTIASGVDLTPDPPADSLGGVTREK